MGKININIFSKPVDPPVDPDVEITITDSSSGVCGSIFDFTVDPDGEVVRLTLSSSGPGLVQLIPPSGTLINGSSTNFKLTVFGFKSQDASGAATQNLTELKPKLDW